MKEKIVLSASRVSCLPVLALCLLAARPARADYDFWAGVPGVSATTNWSDGANWTGPIQTYYNEVEFTGIGAAGAPGVINNGRDDRSSPLPPQIALWELHYAPT